jgi:molybdopterin-guanine dinucleotide biosynthesis protein A
VSDHTVPLGAVVLAGGRSSRMGADKAAIDFCGTRMIDLATHRLAELTDRIVVVARQHHGLSPTVGQVIEDERPFGGPLPALVAGLRATGAERNLVVACDMPFLNTAFLVHLAGLLTDEFDAVVPTTANGFEPLHAAYGDCAIEPLLAAIAAGDRSLRAALERLRVRWVPEVEWKAFDDGSSFLNVNTPDELAAAAALHTSR